MGAADEHAALRAQHGRGLVEDDLHVARVLGVLARELPRAVADDDVLERAQRALGLGDDLVGDHQHVARLVAAVAQQGGEVVARAHLGQAVERPRPQGAQAHGVRPPGGGVPFTAVEGCAGRAAPAVRACAPRRRCARRARRAGPRGRRRCRRRARASAARPRASARRWRLAACSWRSRLPGPKLGPMASGGASSSALVPVPWRSGTMTTSGALIAPATSSSTSRGSSAGQSPGTSRTRS